MKILFHSFLFVFLFALFCLPVNAAFDRLYIDDSIYEGEVLFELDEVYISYKDTVKIFKGKSITLDDSTMMVCVDGIASGGHVILHRGEYFVPIFSVCDEFDAAYTWDKQKQRIDIKTNNASRFSVAVSAEEKANLTRRQKPELKISLFNKKYEKNVMDEVTAVRVFANVENTYFRDVKAKAICKFYLSGKVLYHTDEVIIEKLPSKSKHRVVFYTYNPTPFHPLDFELEVKEIR